MPEHAPVQPENTTQGEGSGVSVTVVPGLNRYVQNPLVHDVRGGSTLTAPGEPPLATVSV
jgi:hypothetical protein